MFLKKGKLILICLTKDKEPISFLNSQLEYLYIQLLSIITADRIRKLEDNPSYCNTALADTNEIFEQMITYSSNTLSTYFNCYHTLIIDSIIRNRINQLCSENLGDALLCIILTPYEIINIIKSEAVSIIPHDIILIQNLIFSNESLRMTESWVPICLPGISDAGYLQLYCNFIEENIGIVYITQYQEHSYFLEFADQSRNIYEIFQKEKILEGIVNAIEHRDKSLINGNEISEDKIIEELISSLKRKSINSLEATSNTDPFDKVKFFVCKHKQTNQYCNYKFNSFDKITDREIKILNQYAKLCDIYKQQNININSNNFLFYLRDDEFFNTITVTENYLLLCSFNFFMQIDDINDLLNEIIKLIKSRENYFFIK